MVLRLVVVAVFLAFVVVVYRVIYGTVAFGWDTVWRDHRPLGALVGICIEAERNWLSLGWSEVECEEGLRGPPRRWVRRDVGAAAANLPSLTCFQQALNLTKQDLRRKFLEWGERRKIYVEATSRVEDGVAKFVNEEFGCR